MDLWVAGPSFFFVELIQHIDHLFMQLSFELIGDLIVGWKILLLRIFTALLFEQLMLFEQLIIFPLVWLFLVVIFALLIEYLVVPQFVGRQSAYLVLQILKQKME